MRLGREYPTHSGTLDVSLVQPWGSNLLGVILQLPAACRWQGSGVVSCVIKRPINLPYGRIYSEPVQIDCVDPLLQF